MICPALLYYLFVNGCIWFASQPDHDNGGLLHGAHVELAGAAARRRVNRERDTGDTRRPVGARHRPPGAGENWQGGTENW